MDIGKQAGLEYPTIYGPVDHKDYIVETVGCGCAFLDYDNDGWMDIFVLSGLRVSGTPKAPAIACIKTNVTVLSKMSRKRRGCCDPSGHLP